MKRLLIIRHGDASWEANNDAERNLTERGRRQAIDALALIKRLKILPERIITSTYTRAQQTALPFLEAFPDVPAEEANWLLPATTAAAAANELQQLPNVSRYYLLFSHQPLVSTLVAQLLDVNIREASRYPMDTASIAQLQSEQGIDGDYRLLNLHHYSEYRSGL